MLAPVLDEIAREQQGVVTIAKVKIEQNQSLASRFRVHSVPTILYFAGGEVRDQTVGVVSKKAITAKLAALRPNPATRQVV